MADVNIKQHDLFMATPTLKSNAVDRKVCNKKNLSWLFGADRKSSDGFFYPHLTLMKDSCNLLHFVLIRVFICVFVALPYDVLLYNIAFAEHFPFGLSGIFLLSADKPLLLFIIFLL